MGALAPLLPRNQRRGGRWRDHRTVVNGILWKLRTGAPWRDLPERYGPWKTSSSYCVRLGGVRAAGSAPGSWSGRPNRWKSWGIMNAVISFTPVPSSASTSSASAT
jgi:transposase